MMAISEKELIKNFGHLEDHQYKQKYNRALGCEVKSKEHFKQLLDKGGYVGFETGNKMAAEYNKNKIKSYDGLSKETTAFIRECKQMADSKGNIKISGRFVEGLKKHGVNIDSVSKIKGLSTHQGGLQNG
jgi:hypothetical protein